MMFFLRLVSGSRTVEFQSSHVGLRQRLSAAFAELTSAESVNSAVLEVFHHEHGWNTVCIDGCYPIIDNPFTLDFRLLRLGVRTTLAECDAWPTAEQQAERRLQMRKQEREEAARHRRRQFVVLSAEGVKSR